MILLIWIILMTGLRQHMERLLVIPTRTVIGLVCRGKICKPM